MRGAKAAAETLRRLGVRHIFGIPGSANIPLYDALLDLAQEGYVRLVLMRHEQAAAHAADGYARASGVPGVCTATSGPGALNLVTGLATAYWDSSPVVAVTGQVPRAALGKLSFQEADIVGVCQNVVKFAVQVRSADEIPLWIVNAFHIAVTGRPGPVLVDVPRDLFTEEVEPDVVLVEPSVRGYRGFTKSVDLVMVGRAVKTLLEAERPLILVGGGAVWSLATDYVVALAELLGAPIVSTLMGKSAVPNDHPLYLGMVGCYGRAEANLAFLEADVVLVVGARLSDRTVPRLEELSDSKKLVLVNLDPAEVNRLKGYVPVEAYMVGDARECLRVLLEALSSATAAGRERSAWMRRVRELKEYYTQLYYGDNGCGKGLAPYKVMKIIREVLPRDAIVTTGVGQHQLWAALFWDALAPRTFITSGGMGTMGFGLPAAIGAKLAQPHRVVVDIDGDGSFLMTATNLATASEEGVPVVVIIFDNGSLGLVRQVQDLFFGGRVVSADFKSSTDFVKLAEALGAAGFAVEDYGDLERALARALQDGGPAVIRVPVAREEFVLPLVPPGGGLKQMMVHDPRRKAC